MTYTVQIVPHSEDQFAKVRIFENLNARESKRRGLAPAKASVLAGEMTMGAQEAGRLKAKLEGAPAVLIVRHSVKTKRVKP